MRTTFFLIPIILGAMLVSCAENHKPKKDNDDLQSEVLETDAEEGGITGKYQIKSGIVTYTSNVMGMDQTTVTTFDDFGNKEVTDTYTEAMGVKLHSRTIVKDGYSYNLNMDEKTGTKVKIYGTGQAIVYGNLTKEMEQKMNLQKLGSETLLGKECEIYGFDYKEMSTSGKAWVWKGVALKSEVKAMGMDVALIGKSFDDNPIIDQSIFEVPDGFKLIER